MLRLDVEARVERGPRDVAVLPVQVVLERAREAPGARAEPVGNKSKGSKKGSRPRSCAQIARFLVSRGARDDIQNQMGLTCRQRIQLEATG